MDYEILYGDEPRFLIEEVKDFIEKGWEPQGGVCFETLSIGREASNGASEVNGRFWQAMVRRK